MNSISKRTLFVLSITFFLINNSTARSDYPFADSLLLHISKDNVNCLYGLKNSRNIWVIPPSFELISEGLSDHRYFIIEHASRVGLVRKDGKFLLRPSYDEINAIAVWYEGNNFYHENNFAYNEYFIVKLGSKRGLLCAQTGKLSIKLQNLSFRRDDKYLITVNDDGLKGLADSGKILLKPVYRTLKELNNSDLLVFSQDIRRGNLLDSNNLGIINKKGKVLVASDYSDFICSAYGFEPVIWASKGSGRKIIGIDLLNLKGLKLLAIPDPEPSLDFHNIYFRNSELALIHCKNRDLLIDVHGTIVSEDEPNSIEFIHFEQNPVSKARFIFRKSRLYGLKDVNGKILIVAKYKRLQSFEYNDNVLTAFGFRHHLGFIAQNDNKFGLIEENDSIIKPFIYSDVFYCDRSIAAFREKKLEVFGLNGLEPSRSGYNFNGGICIFCKEEKNENGFYFANYQQCGVIDTGFNLLLSPEFEFDYIKEGNWFFNNHKGIKGHINSKDKIEIVYSESYIEIGHFQDGYTHIITPGNKAGIINENYELMTDTIYDVVSDFDPVNGIVWVKEYMELPLDSDEPDYSADDRSYGNWGLVDLNRKLILNTLYTYPAAFFNQQAILEKDLKMGVVDIHGATIIPFNYDSIFYADTFYYILYKDRKYGLANHDGKIICKTVFDDMSPFLGNYALIVMYGQLGIVDKKGKIIPNLSRYLQSKKISIGEMLDFSSIYISKINSDRQFERTDDAEYKELINKVFERDTFLDASRITLICSHLGLILSKNFLLNAYNWLPYISHPDIHYSKIFESENYYDIMPEASSESVSIDLKSINKSTFSYSLQSIQTEYGGFSEGFGHSYYNFLNYGFTADSLRKIELNDLFIWNYRKTFETIFIQALSREDRTDIDCKNPEALLGSLDRAFAITSEGLIFYVNPTGDIGDEFFEFSEPVEILIEYELLKTILNLQGPLGEFVKK